MSMNHTSSFHPPPEFRLITVRTFTDASDFEKALARYPLSTFSLSDPWPLNPDGELMLGLKIENVRALVNVEVTTRVPGITFAEWGPGDMSTSMGYKNMPGEPWPDEILEARDRVRNACEAAGIAFLEGATPDTIAEKIDSGVRVVSSGGQPGEATAKAGRAHSGRTMPV